MWPHYCDSPVSETICRTHDSTCWLKFKVSIEGHKFESLIFLPLHIFFYQRYVWVNGWLGVTYVLFNSISVMIGRKGDYEKVSETICRTHESTCWLMVKVSIEGHKFASLIFLPLHIFFPKVWMCGWKAWCFTSYSIVF